MLKYLHVWTYYLKNNTWFGKRANQRAWDNTSAQHYCHGRVKLRGLGPSRWEHLLYKYKDLSLDPSTHIRSWGWHCAACDPRAVQGKDRRVMGVYWLPGELQTHCWTTPQRNEAESYRVSDLLSSFGLHTEYVYWHTCMCKCTHTHTQKKSTLDSPTHLQNIEEQSDFRDHPVRTRILA